jgi:hypothetical protein
MIAHDRGRDGSIRLLGGSMPTAVSNSAPAKDLQLLHFATVAIRSDESTRDDRLAPLGFDGLPANLQQILTAVVGRAQ